MERATRLKIRIGVWVVLTAGVVGALYHFVGLGDVMPWRFDWRGEHWELSEPVWLWMLALVPVVFLLRGFSLSDHSRLQQAVGVGPLRSALLVLLALALARPRTLTQHSRVCTVFLVDVSDSVSPKQIAEARRYIQKVYERRGKNLVRVVTFGRRPLAIDIPEGAKKIPPLRRTGASVKSAPGAGGAASDLQAALQLAHGLYPAGYVKRAVILSDGIETKGDLLTEAALAADQGLRIHHRLYRESPREEVLIRDLTLPKKVDVGKPFKLQANVYASHTTRATFTLKYGTSPNEMYWNERQRRRTVTLKPGLNPVVFSAEVHEPGLVAYVVSMQLPKVKRTDGTTGVRDHVRENNRAVAILTVKDKPRVLLVEGHGRGRVAPFVRMMRQEDLQVEVRSGYGLPSSVWGLKKYDCVILSDVRAELVSMAKMAALDSYVRNHGGCFIMAGGDDSFGSGGYGRTRIERMLPVRMDVDKMNRKPSVALVLVIDRSGSMGGHKIEMAKEAAKAAATALGARDEIGVVAHDSRAIPIIPLTKAANRMRILNAISTISTGGGTNIYPGLRRAHQWLQSSVARVKHVIILSDGDSEQASELPVLAEAMRGERITVSTVGVGTGYNRMLLERIARAGGGKSFFARDPRQIPKIFVKETQRVSRTGVIDEAVKAILVKTASFLRGVDIPAAPMLRGYNPTTVKHGADLYLRTNPFGEPLLARWRLGTGKTAAFTSDIKGRWAYGWLARWMHGTKRLWAQLLRDTMRVRTYKQFPLFTTVSGGRVHVVVDAIDKRDTFQNGLDSVLTVYDWWKPSRKRRVKLRQTSAGRYEASFTMHRFGAYVLQADHRRATTVRAGAGKKKSLHTTVAKSFGAVTLTYPPEYLQLQPTGRECRADPDLCPGQKLLGRASALTGGASLGDPVVSARAIFDAGKIKMLRYREMWHWLAYLMLGLVLIDLLLRRSRILVKPRRMTD